MNEKFVLDFTFYDFVKDSVIHSHFCLVLIRIPEDLFYLMTSSSNTVGWLEAGRDFHFLIPFE